MPTSGPSLCLITPGQLASTPRLVKNADALASAGYRVHVVAGKHFAPAEPLEAAILAGARWSCARVSFHHGFAGAARRLLRQLARRRLLRHPLAVRLAARAQHAGTHALAAAAAQIPAALYFGHGGVAGLAAGAFASQRRRTRYAFDVEDWHEEESDFVLHDPAERTAVRNLLRSLLPGTAFVTCAAPLIGDALTRAYAVNPVCLLNVFPLAEAPVSPSDAPPPTSEQPAVLYWFSQTVGSGRGLEGMLAVLGRMQTPATLHLRGFVSSEYRAELTTRAQNLSVRPPVFLPPAPAAQMARLAAGAHLGLSLEESAPPNRDLCLTNKIFTYLLAGLPVGLTPTRAQQALAPELGLAAVPLDLAAPGESAARLDAWLTSPARARAAETAARLARERFNWDGEQHHLLTVVARHLLA